MRLYTISGAPRGWRVQLALVIKGIDFEISFLEGSKREHKQEAYLAINPRGKVPTIEFNGQHITDSLGIMAWLDRQFPERPLFGSTPQEAGAIWSLTTDLEDFLRPAQHSLIFPLLVERKQLSEMTPKEHESFKEAANNLFKEIQSIEDRLRKTPFLCGEQISAADAVAFPELRIIQRAIDVVPESMEAFGFVNLKSQFPQIHQWMEGISAIPNFQKSLPGHWSKAAA